MYYCKLRYCDQAHNWYPHWENIITQVFSIGKKWVHLFSSSDQNSMRGHNFGHTQSLYQFFALIIFHNKIWQRQELCNFFLQWPWTCWMTLGQDQGTPLWEVKLPIVFYKKDIDWTSIMHFLFQWSWTCPNALG